MLMKVTGTFIFFPMLATTLIIRLSEPLPQYFFFNTGFVSLKHLSPSVLFQSSLLLKKENSMIFKRLQVASTVVKGEYLVHNVQFKK
jgi:hypothetical protein